MVHRCEVEYTARGFVVTCPECGTVGGPQEYLGDAHAIAVRHEEVGGFER